MATMDVFNSDAFSSLSLTTAVENRPYNPGFLGSLNLFAPRPIRTVAAAIEERDGTLSLIQTSNRGAPLAQRTTEARKIHYVSTNRIAKGDRITADEIQNIRAFGSESELTQVQAEVARRLDGFSGLRADVEMTHENMRLGAVQGIVTDADDAELQNYYTLFSVTQQTEIDFDLDNATPASGAVRIVCNQVVRQTLRAAKGAWTPSSYIMAICGDTFWDQLTAHSEVRATYLQTQQAQDLRNDVGMAFESFRYGGITFTNYRGTDDNSTVAVGVTKAAFFPVNAPGVFEVIYSPGESIDMVNQPGREVYAMSIPDTDRNQYVDIEVYSYPLHICTKPLMLQNAKNT